MTRVYTVDGFADLFETAEQLPDIEKRGQIYAFNDHTEESDLIHYRTPLISENENVVGDVSKGYYEISQFEDVIANLGHAAQEYDDMLDVTGNIMVTDGDHKLTSYIGFDGLTAEPIEGDELELGIKTQAAHTGVHGIKYDIGAQRVVCSNGMVAFDSEKSYQQTHNDPLDYTLAKNAVDSIVHGVEEIENRIARAHKRTFKDEHEAILALRHLGVGDELDEPFPALEDALQAEVTRGDQPTLWDAYNAATRVYTHQEGLEANQRDRGLERSARLLDDYGEVPEAQALGEAAVTQRAEALTDDEEEPEFDNEEEVVSGLLQQYGEA